MARINIRDIEDDVKNRLKLRAARHGRSLEEEVRTILRQAAGGMNGPELLAAMQQNFGAENGIDLDLDRSRSSRSGIAEL
ncbi:MAG: FitA-like ribbon-helix-helix domain-containing protein [Rhodospirillaceae bacterium]